ncbi:hypothetical protein [Rhizosphaericola mali]|uniref:Uncharacterized protein n=1 Tax=Rhizosphaericola mali TaxID=2545455 RepID=A0A5P2G8I9_9BACT|nr:hypothetical protein [Rhizosphaericola mali]QES90060.1 hypothetical protein E0W69_015820 [Rhizosphaericola mali]
MENFKTSNMQTILCIPGNWATRTDLIAAIIDNNPNEYVFAGNILLNTKTNEGFEIQIEPKDARMKDSFAIAGMVNSVSNAFLSEIENHSLVIYLFGKTGNVAGTKSIADAAGALLKAGVLV